HDRLHQINPTTTIETVAGELDDAGYAKLMPTVDAVVDATDNFATRFAINHHSVRWRKPLVSGAAIRFEGQVSVYRPDLEDSPCYRCLYNEAGGVDGSCSTNGVVAPLLGIIGSVQAMETIKVLL